MTRPPPSVGQATATDFALGVPLLPKHDRRDALLRVAASAPTLQDAPDPREPLPRGSTARAR